jgi:hypothetical protein
LACVAWALSFFSLALSSSASMVLSLCSHGADQAP